MCGAHQHTTMSPTLFEMKCTKLWIWLANHMVNFTAYWCCFSQPINFVDSCLLWFLCPLCALLFVCVGFIFVTLSFSSCFILKVILLLWLPSFFTLFTCAVALLSVFIFLVFLLCSELIFLNLPAELFFMFSKSD